MKKAAIILLLSSTAFAATTAPMLPPQNGRQVSPLAPQKRKQVVVENAQDKAPQTAAQVAPQKAPQAGPQNPRRLPHAALAANVKPVLPPKKGPFELKAQLRNIMTLANGEELRNEGGKNFGLSSEARVGIKHESGFGATVTGTYQTNNFADNSANTGSNGDASLMLHHPSIVKNDNVNLFGYARLYAPTSEKSRNNNIRTAAYYGILDIQLSKNWSLETLALIRGFWRPTYGDTDLQSFYYQDLELSRKVTDWASLSLGVQYEADNTYAKGMNQEIDIYPFVDFTITPNILFEPKFYFPLYTNGQGSVNSKGAALNQGYAEFFLKLSI